MYKGSSEDICSKNFCFHYTLYNLKYISFKCCKLVWASKKISSHKLKQYNYAKFNYSSQAKNDGYAKLNCRNQEKS